jgi:thymidylate synthase
MKHPEQQYLDLLRQIMESGTERTDRTGVGTKGIWGVQLRFDLSQGFPLFTTRQLFPRIGIEEMLFFLRGQTNSKILEDKGIRIWTGNTSREFLDSRGLSHLPEGEMGKSYGFQMRNFGGTDSQPGYDQLRYLVDNLRSNPNDRRHLMVYWHPQSLKEAALPSCHYSVQFQVDGNRLNCMWTQRSADMYLGAPTNCINYGFYCCWLAKMLGYEPGWLVGSIADAHIYKTHFEVVEQQLARIPLPFPQLRFKKDFSTLEEGLAIEYSDIEIIGYQHCGKLASVPMAI